MFCLFRMCFRDSFGSSTIQSLDAGGGSTTMKVNLVAWEAAKLSFDCSGDEGCRDDDGVFIARLLSQSIDSIKLAAAK
jgi:hypothetical protein